MPMFAICKCPILTCRETVKNKKKERSKEVQRENRSTSSHQHCSSPVREDQQEVVSPRLPLNDQGGLEGLAQVVGTTQGAETTLLGGRQRCIEVHQQVDKSRRSGNL